MWVIKEGALTDQFVFEKLITNVASTTTAGE